MKTFFIIICLSVMYPQLTKLSAQDTSGFKVTFVNNETFLLTSGSKKVLIDAPYASTVVRTSSATLQKIRMATSPFDSIDLICITHNHQDHFGMSGLGQHLENDQKTSVICPNSVADKMKSYANYDLIKDRILKINPAFNSKDSVVVNGIPVKILGFRHAMPEFYTMDHECFLIDIDGIKIFHSGDSWGTYIDELEAFQLQNDNIDIAFLMVEYFWDGAGRDPLEGLEKAQKYLAPKNIVIMHNQPDFLNGGQQIINAVENDFPNIYLFKDELEKKILQNGVLIDYSNETGTKEYANKPIDFFPNPAVDLINISFGTTPVREVLVGMYNLQGSLVTAETFYNSEEANIDLTGLPEGLYAIKIIADGKTHEALIIKK